jgi:hypothetical protein
MMAHNLLCIIISDFAITLSIYAKKINHINPPGRKKVTRIESSIVYENENQRQMSHNVHQKASV